MPVSDDTKDMLGQVKKGKSRKFVMITKGPAVIGIVLYKKGAPEKHITAAKKETGGGVACFGVIEGQGNDVTMKLASLDGFKEPPVKDLAVKKFFEDEAGLKCKPAFEMVELLPTVLDETDPLHAKFIGLQDQATQVGAAKPDLERELGQLCRKIARFLDHDVRDEATTKIAELDALIGKHWPSGTAAAPSAASAPTAAATPTAAAPSAEPATPPSPERAAYEAQRDKLKPVLAGIAKAVPDKAPVLLEMWKLAELNAASGDYAKASKTLVGLTEGLKRVSGEALKPKAATPAGNAAQPAATVPPGAAALPFSALVLPFEKRFASALKVDAAPFEAARQQEAADLKSDLAKALKTAESLHGSGDAAGSSQELEQANLLATMLLSRRFQLKDGKPVPSKELTPQYKAGDIRAMKGKELNDVYRNESDSRYEDDYSQARSADYIDADGKLRTYDGRAVDTERDGQDMYTSRLDTGTSHRFSDKSGDHHSYAPQGTEVIGAGKRTVQDGVVRKITGESGHYTPSATNIHAYLEGLMEQGVRMVDESLFMPDPANPGSHIAVTDQGLINDWNDVVQFQEWFDAAKKSGKKIAPDEETKFQQKKQRLADLEIWPGQKDARVEAYKDNVLFKDNELETAVKGSVGAEKAKKIVEVFRAKFGDTYYNAGAAGKPVDFDFILAYVNGERRKMGDSETSNPNEITSQDINRALGLMLRLRLDVDPKTGKSRARMELDAQQFAQTGGNADAAANKHAMNDELKASGAALEDTESDARVRALYEKLGGDAKLEQAFKVYDAASIDDVDVKYGWLVKKKIDDDRALVQVLAARFGGNFMPAWIARCSFDLKNRLLQAQALTPELQAEVIKAGGGTTFETFDDFFDTRIEYKSSQFLIEALGVTKDDVKDWFDGDDSIMPNDLAKRAKLTIEELHAKLCGQKLEAPRGAPVAPPEPEPQPAAEAEAPAAPSHPVYVPPDFGYFQVTGIEEKYIPDLASKLPITIERLMALRKQNGQILVEDLAQETKLSFADLYAVFTAPKAPPKPSHPVYTPPDFSYFQVTGIDEKYIPDLVSKLAITAEQLSALRLHNGQILVEAIAQKTGMSFEDLYEALSPSKGAAAAAPAFDDENFVIEFSSDSSSESSYIGFERKAPAVVDSVTKLDLRLIKKGTAVDPSLKDYEELGGDEELLDRLLGLWKTQNVEALAQLQALEQVRNDVKKQWEGTSQLDAELKKLDDAQADERKPLKSKLTLSRPSPAVLGSVELGDKIALMNSEDNQEAFLDALTKANTEAKAERKRAKAAAKPSAT